MPDEPGQQWVVAEQRGDGTQWPLLIVGDEREAADIVQSLRDRGRDVVAVSVALSPEPMT